MMKSLLALIGIVALAQSLPHSQFAAFKQQYNKSYTDLNQEIARLRIFEANLAKIEAHNADSRWTYTLGVNQYADLTAAEFAKIYASGKRWDPASQGTQPHETAGDLSVEALPKDVDWREKKVVTPAKNQGGCGSCWAFSTAETLESHIAIKTGKLMKFSPQEYVSCMPNPKHCGGTG